jgi:hypothetical protein
MMNTNLVKILEQSKELIIKARLLTAYSNRQGFSFPSETQSMWFIDPDKDRIKFYYPPTFQYSPMLHLPADDSKLMHFCNRISLSKVHQWQDSYSSGIDEIQDNAGNNFYFFKSAHREITFLLQDVIRFLCGTTASFDQDKKNILSSIKQSKLQFSKHPILHESHCEQILFEIENLIMNTQDALYIDRKFDLYCLLQIIHFEKTEEQIRIYARMKIGDHASAVINSAIDKLPKSNLFGYSRSQLIQNVGKANNTLKGEFSEELNRFNKLNTILMLCYCDALDFIRNSIQYAKGDTAVIDFDQLIAQTESKLSITKEIRRGLVEGQLYKALNLKTSYQPIFDSARQMHAELS